MAQQLKKKFIGNNEVDGSKILLEQGQSIKIKDSTGTEVELVKLGASDEVLVKGEQVALKSSVDQEISDRQSGDAQLASDLSSETSARIAADDIHDTRLTTAEGNIASQGVSIGQLQSDLSSETSARIAADDIHDSRLTTVEGVAATNSVSIGQLQSDLSSETNARIAADNIHDSRLTTVEGVAASNSVSIGQIQSDLSSETSARIAADGVLQSEIDTLSGSVSSNYSELDGKITTEKNRAEGAEQALSGRLDSLEADPVTKTYVDGKVSFLISNVSPEAIDSFSEVVTAFQQADSDLNGAITSLANSASAALSAEEAARISADSALDARVDVLESVVWKKEKFSIVNGQTSVTLSHTPEAGSMSAFVDRLAIHEGASEDYSVSGAIMTFLNDLVSPGQSQIGSGDTVYVKYQYKI